MTFFCLHLCYGLPDAIEALFHARCRQCCHNSSARYTHFPSSSLQFSFLTTFFCSVFVVVVGSIVMWSQCASVAPAVARTAVFTVIYCKQRVNGFMVVVVYRGFATRFE